MKWLNKSVILFFFLLSLSVTAQSNRGVYIWPSTFFEKGGVDSVFNQLRENKISDIFLLVKGEAGYSLFSSDYTVKDYYQSLADTTNNSIEKAKYQELVNFYADKNLLPEIINKAHQLKMKIHAWFIISGDRHYVETHPGAEVVRLPNQKADKYLLPATDKGHVNLAYPLYKNYIFSLINKALELPFDGLMLDKIRYTSVVYTWDEIHLSKAIRIGLDINKIIDSAVKSSYGTDEDKDVFINMYRNNDKDITGWIKLKKEDIEDYVKEAYKITREKKIELSASFMPEGAYDEGFADVNYAQNYSELSHYLDYIVIMAYPKSFSMPESWIKMVTANAKAKSSCKIWTAIQGYDTLSTEFIYNQVKDTRIVKSDGIAVFRFGGMSEDMWKSFRDGMNLNIEPLQDSQIPGIVYTGAGTIRNCWLKSAEATFKCDDIIPYMYNEKYISDYSRFSDKKFILVPGGGGSDIAAAIDTTGLDNIEKFVKNGGGYIGICAGSYLPVKGYNNNLTCRLQIVNADAADIQHWNRGSGKVTIETSSKHQIFSGMDSKEFEMSYFNGPVFIPSDLKLPAYKPLAVFKTDLHENGAAPGFMLNKAAIIEAKYNKGKIILFSPHPELTPGKESMLFNAVKYVSGRK
jgi:glutamine amidotransferase-like uncharacterized protein/uncharacterized lipoprotein YddW (UPF0748 family)